MNGISKDNLVLRSIFLMAKKGFTKFTFLRFRIIGWGLSSSIENCRLAGSKSAPGMVARANSSAENSTLTSSLRLRSSLSLSILALLLSTYKNPFSP